jgi:hypothetical protein
MSSIEQRIAEVLREHWPVRDPNGHINGTVPNSVAVYDCWCESITNTTHDAVTDHVASVLAAELGLRPAFMARHESGGGRGFGEEPDARQFVNTFVPRPPRVDDPGSGTYTHVEKRWVTRWEQA